MQYKPLVIGYHNGAPCASKTSRQVVDSQQTIRQAGLPHGKPSVNMLVFRQPGANIITTVDAVKAAIPALPGLRAARPAHHHHPRSQR